MGQQVWLHNSQPNSSFLPWDFPVSSSQYFHRSLGTRRDSAVGNGPNSRAINHRQWEQRRLLDEEGARGIASGCLDLWHPLAPLAMDAFDRGLKATVLEGEIKGWGEKKGSSFFLLSHFFFFLMSRGRGGTMATPPPGAAHGDPAPTNLPHPTVLNKPNLSAPERPKPITCTVQPTTGELLPEDEISHSFCPRCREGGNGEGKEEGNPVNKPGLNKLLGAAGAEHALIDIEIRCNPSPGTGPFHGQLKRTTLKGKGKNLFRGRANQSVAGVVWRGMLSAPDGDSLLCHRWGRCRVRAAKCPLGLGTRWVLSESATEGEMVHVPGWGSWNAHTRAGRGGQPWCSRGT